MQELSLATLVAVLEEMFGTGAFWAMVTAAALAALVFVVLLIRDRGLRARRLVRAELLAPLGGVAAVALVWAATSSGIADVGGPIDALALAAVFLAGAGGAVVIGYILGSLLARRA